ncbi:TraX protein [Chlamydia trachomatis]|nr:TraX protein [Chlamydia trachomatis]
MQKISLNAAHLKYIAYVSMFLDHFNKDFLLLLNRSYHPLLAFISDVCAFLGIIAFPIFCFFDSREFLPYAQSAEDARLFDPIRTNFRVAF